MKDILVERELVDTQNKPQKFLELNEKGTVPVLRTDDGKVLTDSADIVDYFLEVGTLLVPCGCYFPHRRYQNYPSPKVEPMSEEVSNV